MQKWVLAGSLVLSLVVGAVLYSVLSHRGAAGDGTEVTWDLLGQMDYIAGKPSAELGSLNNHNVKIPGFMVPLEDSSKEVSEFLLVPTPQACIHVPPPPPNQMVYVKMRHAAEVAFGPIWVYGTFKITDKKHMYGVASFELEGDAIEAYR